MRFLRSLVRSTVDRMHGASEAIRSAANSCTDDTPVERIGPVCSASKQSESFWRGDSIGRQTFPNRMSSALWDKRNLQSRHGNKKRRFV